MSESLLAGATVAAPAAPAAPTAPITGAAPAAGATPIPEPEGKPADSVVAVEGAPETYAEFNLPEDVALGELGAEVGVLAKELGLPQAQAQKVVDLAAKITQQNFAAQAETVKALHLDWENAVKNDKDIGGPALDENLAKAKAAMQASTTPQLQVLLERSGLAHHPDFVRHFLKLAPLFAVDTVVTGGAPVVASKSAASTLYPTAA